MVEADQVGCIRRQQGAEGYQGAQVAGGLQHRRHRALPLVAAGGATVLYRRFARSSAGAAVHLNAGILYG